VKRHWIEYTTHWTPQPLSYWVHREADGKHWREAEAHEPPLPGPVPGKGFAVYFVEVDGFVFRFASLAELDECVRVLSQRVLPTSRRLSEERGTGYGPNNHWLSRLPKGMKSWRYRQKAVKCLQAARQEFESEIRPGQRLRERGARLAAGEEDR
jgi:hypothetical protein